MNVREQYVHYTIRGLSFENDDFGLVFTNAHLEFWNMAHDTAFGEHLAGNDEDRIEDALVVRELFDLDPGREDVSVFEVLIGLARRLTILMDGVHSVAQYKPNNWYRWLLEMTNNMCDFDNHPDRVEMEESIQGFVTRTYALHLDYGHPFPVDYLPKHIDIWYLMHQYLSENYELD